IEARAIDDVALTLDGIVSGAVTVRIAGVGSFERRGRIDTLWAGVAPRAPLAALHRKIDRALVAAGIAPDTRAYHPHVTLARLARGAGGGPALAQWLVAHAALASPAFILDRLVLYESTLGRGGASYREVMRVALL
ncbi:MAG: RNA 2',3'-cyclic phosphodiesterase, partial [Pseudomonadota bacterium]